jgi:hypothetical protein
MKRSASVRLTIVAAAGMAAQAQQRPNPCALSTFSSQACSAAVTSGGYCWNGQWVRLQGHYPYPYYYDQYQQYVANGGASTPAAVGSCAPISHGAVARAGFGATAASHSTGS